MAVVFFSETQHALDNITTLFDSVWPTAVGLWNLRCHVNGLKKEFPSISETELASKFTLGSGIHGVNYKRAFVEKTWEQQQADFAWIILNSAFPIYEGWLESLKKTIFPNMNLSSMQSVTDLKNEVTRLTANRSVTMGNSFYPVYLTKKDRYYPKIEALMYCFRLFKNARNCYMHNGSIADSRLINSYNNYTSCAPDLTQCTSEIPEFYQPTLGNNIQITLRGVVGFSDILRKIMISLDTELMCAVEAENEFISRYKAKHTTLRTLKSDPNAAKRQVIQYVKQCGYVTPVAVEDLITFLAGNHLLIR